MDRNIDHLINSDPLRQLLIFEPDPIASFILQRRWNSVKTIKRVSKFDFISCIEKNDPFAEDSTHIFWGLLGQLGYTQTEVSMRRLREKLNHRAWFSIHDAYSVKLSQSQTAKLLANDQLAKLQTFASGEESRTQLKQQLQNFQILYRSEWSSKQNSQLEVFDHMTSEFDKSDRVIRVPWRLTPSQFHWLHISSS